MQPAAQQPSAHGGRGAVEHACERQFRPVGEADVEFEIAACGRIHQHGGIARFGDQTA